MALSYYWFWEEFCAFLFTAGAYPILKDESLIVVFKRENNIENLWDAFLSKLGSSKSVELNMGHYFKNKLIYKQKGARAPSTARAWTQDDVPIVSEGMRNFLIAYYKNIKKAPIIYFQEDKCKRAIEKLDGYDVNSKHLAPPFFDGERIVKNFIRGGDHHKDSCAGCGKSFQSHEIKYERINALLKDGNERLQSGKTPDSPKPQYCSLCVLQVILCPLKLSQESLTVRFVQKANNTSFSVKQILHDELRKFTSQSLHVLAGDFVSLHINESVDKKPLSTTMGTYHYALWKMSVTFPPELFEKGFGVDVYPGEESFHLPQWQLWLVSAFAAWNDVFRYKCYGDKDLRPHFNHYIRLTSQKKVFHAFYELIAGELIHASYSQTWKMIKLQDIWEMFETILMKEEKMPIPDYPRIVGFAGLLLPLAQRVESSQQSPNEKKRAITKLLEEVDRPIQYAYTASRDSGSKDFIFCKRPSNKYFFDKALELLSWAGEDIANLMAEGKRIVNENQAFSWARDSEEKIFVSADQIARVTAALVSEGEKPYSNEADWRAFAYQVKLALWSFFPGYLGSQD